MSSVAPPREPGTYCWACRGWVRIDGACWCNDRQVEQARLAARPMTAWRVMGYTLVVVFTVLVVVPAILFVVFGVAF